MLISHNVASMIARVSMVVRVSMGGGGVGKESKNVFR